MNAREGRAAVSRMHALTALAAEDDYAGIAAVVRAMTDRQREHLITEMARALVNHLIESGHGCDEIAACERQEADRWASLTRKGRRP